MRSPDEQSAKSRTMKIKHGAAGVWAQSIGVDPVAGLVDPHEGFLNEVFGRRAVAADEIRESQEPLVFGFEDGSEVRKAPS